MKSPFPYFGGKSAVADLVWSRFGDVPNYVEPFAGSAAILLNRPHWPWDGHRIETINDADCFLANFWRALQSEPEAVARHADWPVNEADLHARHLWLVNVAVEHVQRLRTEPDYYDAKIAGWWVWGCCQWIGSGWCHHPEWQKLPHLGDAGREEQTTWQQVPSLAHHGQGIHSKQHAGEIYEYFAALADRLRRVRVCCGDWSRVCGPTPTVKQGLTAVFLDPPYTEQAGRKNNLYASDDLDIGHAVRDWAVEWGEDSQMRIALCGYAGEYEIPGNWECVAWKARGGYGSQGDGESTAGRENATKERIWFSPHCLKATGKRQLALLR